MVLKKQIIQGFEHKINHQLRVCTAGNITDVLYMNHWNTESKIIKLSKDDYLVKATGDIKQFQHSENRAENENSFKQTFTKLRNLINANTQDISKCKWITLTYAENMTDPIRLNKDFKKFIRKMRKEFGAFEYIQATEPQERGAWHIHLLLIFDNTAPFIPNNHLSDIWGQGFTKTKKLDPNNDNVGAYLTAYMTDVELTPETQKEALNREIIIKEVDGKPKKIIKGGRLYMYPPGFNFYTASRGVKRPITEWELEIKLHKKIGSANPTFERTLSYEIETDGLCKEVLINRRQYKSFTV